MIKHQRPALSLRALWLYPRIVWELAPDLFVCVRRRRGQKRNEAGCSSAFVFQSAIRQKSRPLRGGLSR
jgi:hypothetical protein